MWIVSTILISAIFESRLISRTILLPGNSLRSISSLIHPQSCLILSNSIRCGVSGLLKTLAAEYGPSNVLVNNVCPGFTKTDRLIELAATLAARKGTTTQQVEQEWASQVPLKRLGEPEDLANTVVFLASERASYVTGISVAVDGGMVKGL